MANLKNTIMMMKKSPRKARLERMYQRLRKLMVLGLAAGSFALPARLMAGPTGEQVVAGQATIQRDGSMTQINAANNTIVNWQGGFNIGKTEAVRIDLPSASSRMLNRDTSGNLSLINGQLSSNGIVYIANPFGVFIGSSAVINTSQLVAAAGTITDNNFLNKVDFFSNITGNVTNMGSIQANAVTLIGKQVQNVGSIVAPDGMVTMASADEVMLQERDGHIMVRLSKDTANPSSGTGVENKGTINAGEKGKVTLAAGDVYALAVNNSGSVKGGQVIVSAEGGRVENHGTLDASSATGKGGSVQVLGKEVALYEGSLINADGATGGGQVNVGGSFQGKGPLLNADYTTVASGATISASATESGDGGNVVVWSDRGTLFGGTILATGPGKGGNVEISGKDGLSYQGGHVTLGQGGQLLLDPKNITVDTNATSGGGVSGNDQFAENAASSITINNGDLGALLTGGATITLQANNDITFDANVTAAGSAALILQAGRSIAIGSSGAVTITLTGAFDATVNDTGAQAANRDAGDAAFTMFTGSSIITNGNGINVVYDAGPNGNDATGAMTISNLNAGAGNIFLSPVSNEGGVQTKENITFNGTVTAATLSVLFAGNISDGATANFAISGGAAFDSDGTGTIVLGDAVGNTTNFGTLSFNGSTVTITEDSATVLDGANFANGALTLTSAGSITNTATATLTVSGLATFSGTSITLGENAGNNPMDFGSLTFNSAGTVTIFETSNTVLAGTNTASSLILESTGSITDSAATSLTVTNDATFTAGSSITLGDNGGDTTNFGTLTFNSITSTNITEDSNMLLVGNSTTGTTATLSSSGSITNDGTAALGFAGLTFLTAGTSIDLGNAVGDTVNFGSIRFVAGTSVNLSENSATQFSGVSTADSLTATSTAAITDAAAASVTITNGATLSGTSISLADNGGDVWSIGGTASLTASGGGSITFASAGTVNFNALTFNTTGTVTITEDSATSLTGTNTASVLSLTSSGAISDASGASVTTTGNATLSGTSISLADNGGDVWSVGGTASLTATAGGVTVASTGTADFNALTFNATGAVDITEDSATSLTGTSTGDSLALTSSGAITDASGASVTITNAASLSGTSISLADNGGDVWSIGGNAALTTSGGGAITFASTGSVNFGSITVTSTGAATITEDSASQLAGTSTADSLSLTSSGAITDAVSASVTLTSGLTLSGTSISLADNGTDVWSVSGNASFTASGGGAITVASAGTVNFGTITFSTSGAVSITEDSASQLTGTNSGDTLALTSSGAITDASGLSVTITNGATLSGTSILLGDNAGDIWNLGAATLTASGGGAITFASAGTVNFVTINFNTTGAVSITEDSNTTLTGTNTADSLSLISAGAMTDAAATSLTVTNAATFSGTAITLNDNGADVLSIGGNASFTATGGGTISVASTGTSNFGTLTFTSTGTVTITEDTATVLSGSSSAGALTLTSAAGITNDATGDIAVTNNAALSGTSITLGENAGNDVNFGSLTFTSAGAVTITEDSATQLSGTSTASSLTLTSSAGITNAAAASLTVTNTAAFSGTTVTLGNQAGDAMNFGSLNFTSAGAVSIAEDSSTTLTGTNTADSLTLSSTGAISNDATADITVTNNASFTTTGGGAITLGENAGNDVNFGSLTFSSAGAVTITEDSATSLSGTSTANSLSLTSSGAITDASGNSLTVTNAASFSGTSISLTDNADTLSIGGNASFTASGGGSITVAATGTANFGTLTTTTTGAVDITEDSSTILTGAITAGTMQLRTAGTITDAAGATINLTGGGASDFRTNAAAGSGDIILNEVGHSVAGTLALRTLAANNTTVVDNDISLDVNSNISISAIQSLGDVVINATGGSNVTITSAATSLGSMTITARAITLAGVTTTDASGHSANQTYTASLATLGATGIQLGSGTYTATGVNFGTVATISFDTGGSNIASSGTITIGGDTAALIQFNDPVALGGLTVNAGDADIAILAGGTIGTTAANDVTFANTGKVTLGNDSLDTLSFSGGLTATASVVGGVETAGIINVATSNGAGDNATIGNSATGVILLADTTIDTTTGGAAAHNITIGPVTGGSHALTLTAGAGTITNNSGISGVTTLTTSNATTQSFAVGGGSTSVSTLSVTSGGSATVTFNGDTTVTGTATTSGAFILQLNGTTTSANTTTIGDAQFGNTGGVITGDKNNDTLIITGQPLNYGLVATGTAGANFTINGSLLTNGKAVHLGNVRLAGLAGETVTINTTNSGNAAGANVALADQAGETLARAGAVDIGLTIITGTAGDITLGAAVANTFTGLNNFTLTGDVIDINGPVTGSGNATITGGGLVTIDAALTFNSGTISLTGNPLQVNAAISLSGSITLDGGANAMTIVGPITSTAGNITVVNSGANNISLADGALSAAAGLVSITSGGAILDSDGGTAVSITGLNISLIADAGIGAAGAGAIDINATGSSTTSGLEFRNITSGNVFITDTTGGLTIANVAGGIAAGQIGNFAAGGTTTLAANSPLLINTDLNFSGDTTLTAGGVPGAAGDDVTFANSAVVTVSSGVARTVTINAGDNIVFNTGSLVTSGGGSHNTTLNANTESSVADGSGGVISQVTGATSINTQNLTLNASHGIGTTGNATFNFTATTLATDSSGNNGTQNLSSTGALALNLLNAGSGAIALTAGGALTDNNAGTNNIAAGTVTLTTTGSIGTSGNLIETAITSLTATATDGSIFIAESNGLTLTSVTATGAGTNDILVTSGGTIVATSVTADDTVTLTATSGDITVGVVTAGTIASLTSSAGAINDNANDATADVIANTSITLSASTGIGASNGSLDINTPTLTSATSTTGGIAINLLNDAAGSMGANHAVAVTSVDATTSGDITLTGTAGSGTRTYTLLDTNNGNISVTATAGDVVLGQLTAGTGGTAGTVSVTATAGQITDDANDAVADIIGSSGTLSASTGIGVSANGSIDLNVTTVTSATSATGGIALNLLNDAVAANGLAANHATTVTLADATTSGNITLTGTAGSGTRTYTLVDTNSGTISVTADAGNIVLGVLTAGTGGTANTVSVTATAGAITDDASDATADVIGSALTISASTGIGQGANGSVDVNVTTLTSATSTTGGIAINLLDDAVAANGLAANHATTITAVDAVTSGNIVLTGTAGSGTRTYTLVDANAGSIDISAAAGNIVLVDVVAGSGGVLNTVAVQATTGAIQDDSNNATVVIGSAITLNSNGDIGATGINGQMDLQTSDLTTNSSLSGGNGNQFLANSGSLTGLNLDAGTNVTTGSGVSNIILTNTGSIADADGARDIRGNDVTLIATGGIGAVTAINTVIHRLDITNNTSGAVNIVNTGALILFDINSDGFSLTTPAGGSILASSPLTISSNATVGGSFTFQATGGGGVGTDDLTINNNSTVTLNGANGTSLTFNAGDDVILGDISGTGNIITSGAGTQSVIIAADTDNAGDAGGSISQTAASGTSIVTETLTMSANSGIGSVAIPLTVTANLITANNTTGTGLGDVIITNLALAATTVTSISSDGGRIDFIQTGGQTLAVTFLDNDADAAARDTSSTPGLVNVSNTAGAMTITDARSHGSLMTLTTVTSGAMTIGSLSAASTGNIDINSAGGATQDGTGTGSGGLGGILASTLRARGTGNFAFFNNADPDNVANVNQVATIAANVTGSYAYIGSPNVATSGVTVGSLTANSVTTDGVTAGTTVVIADDNNVTVSNTPAATDVSGVGVTLDAGAATVTVAASAVVNSGAGALVIHGDEIDFNTANQIRGTSTILLDTETTSRAILLGGGAGTGVADGTLNLTDAEIAALQEGFSAITIGNASGTHTITIDSASFLDSVTIRAPLGAGNIIVNNTAGATPGITTRSSTDAASVTLQAFGGGLATDIRFNIGDDILTKSGAITLDLTGGSTGGTVFGPDAGTVLISSAPVLGDGAAITIDGDLAGTGANNGNLETLQVRAGTGVVTLNGTMNPVALTTGGFYALVPDIEGATVNIPQGTYFGNPIFTGDAILFPGVANSIVPGAHNPNLTHALGKTDLNFTLQPKTAGLDIGVKNIAIGGLQITQGNLDDFADGFASITIGREDGTGNLVINTAASASSLILKDPIFFRMGQGDITVNNPGGGAAAIRNSETAASFAIKSATDGSGFIRDTLGDVNVFNGSESDSTNINFNTAHHSLIGSLTYKSADSTTLLAGRQETDGTAIEFLNAVELTGATTLVTTGITGNLGGVPAGAHIRFEQIVNGTSSGTEDLTLIAGNLGDITFVREVGGNTKLGNVLIADVEAGTPTQRSVRNFLASENFTARSFIQNNGAGNTSFIKNLTTAGNATAPIGGLGDGGQVNIFTNGAILISATVGTSMNTSGGVAGAGEAGRPGGDVTLVGASISVNAIDTSGSGANGGNTNGGDAGDVSMNVATVAANRTLTQNGGTINLRGNITAAGGTPSGAGTTGLGGNVTIGDDANAGGSTTPEDAIVVNASNLTITTTGSTGGNVVFDGTTDGNANNITLVMGNSSTGGSFSTEDSGDILGNVTAFTVTSGKNATFNAVVGGTSGTKTVGAMTFTLNNDLIFNADVFMSGQILVNTAHDFLVQGLSGSDAGNNSQIIAGNIAQTTGSGLTQFTGKVTTTNALGINITNQNVTFGDGTLTDTVTVNAAGNVTVGIDVADTGAGTLIINQGAPLNLIGGGAFTQNGAGTNPSVVLLKHNGNTITTNGGGITFRDHVRLDANTTLSTGAAVGGDILFDKNVFANNQNTETLTLTAGSGNITVNGDTGTSNGGATADKRLGGLTITSANNVNFNGKVDSVSFLQTLGTGTTTFGDNVADNVHITTDMTFTSVNDVVAVAPVAVDGSLLVTSAHDLTFNSTLTVLNDMTVTTFHDATFVGAVVVGDADGDDLVFGTGHNITFNNTLTVGFGNATITNINDGVFTGAVLIGNNDNDSLLVSTAHNLTFSSTLTVGFGDATFTNINDATFTGAVVVGNNDGDDLLFTTAHNVTFSSTLDVDFGNVTFVTVNDATFTGAVDIGNDINDNLLFTTAHNVTFSSTLDVTGDATFTSANDVTFAAPAVIGDDLTFTTVRDIISTSNLQSFAVTSDILIGSARNVTIDGDVTAATFTQTIGTGTTTIGNNPTAAVGHDDVFTISAGNATFATVNDVVINALTTISAGNLDFSVVARDITLGHSALKNNTAAPFDYDISGNLHIKSARAVAVEGSVHTGGFIQQELGSSTTTFNGHIKVDQAAGASPDGFSITTSGLLTISKTLNLVNGSNFFASVGDIELTGGIDSIFSGVLNTGVLTVQPFAVGANMSIGANAAGGVHMSNDDVDALKNGFNHIFMGRADGTGTMSIGSNSPATFKDPTFFRMPVDVGATLATEGVITIINEGVKGLDNATLTFDSNVLNLGGKVVTSGNAVFFVSGGSQDLADPASQRGDNVGGVSAADNIQNITVIADSLIDTTNAAGTGVGLDVVAPNGANITIENRIDNFGTLVRFSLDIAAGLTGDIEVGTTNNGTGTIDGIIGGTSRVGDLTILSANDTTFGGIVFVTNFEQIDAADNTGQTRFLGTQTPLAALGGQILASAQGATTPTSLIVGGVANANSGTVEIDVAGDLFFAGAINATGGPNTIGGNGLNGGAVNLAGDNVELRAVLTSGSNANGGGNGGNAAPITVDATDGSGGNGAGFIVLHGNLTAVGGLGAGGGSNGNAKDVTLGIFVGGKDVIQLDAETTQSTLVNYPQDAARPTIIVAGNDVIFNGTIDSLNAGTANSQPLIVNTFNDASQINPDATGRTYFNGNIGSINPLRYLMTDLSAGFGAGTNNAFRANSYFAGDDGNPVVTVSGTVKPGDLVFNALPNGQTFINAASVSVQENIFFADPTIIALNGASPATVTITANDITFLNTLNEASASDITNSQLLVDASFSPAATQSLLLNTIDSVIFGGSPADNNSLLNALGGSSDSGVTSFFGVVGGITPLGSIATNANGHTTTYANITTDIAAAEATLGDKAGQTYNDPFFVAADVTLTHTGNGGVNGDGSGVFFNNVVDTEPFRADDLGTHFDLTVITTGGGITRFGDGVASFNGLMDDVGFNFGLKNLTTDSTGNSDGRTLIRAASITTTQDQTFNDPVVLNNVNSLVTLNGNDITFVNTLDEGNGSGTSDADVLQRLLINTSGSGVTRFNAVVGGNNPLARIETNADGTTEINANMTTNGVAAGDGMIFNDNVVLTGNAVLSQLLGDATTFVKFNANVNGAFDLTVNTPAGAGTFFGNASSDNVGGTTPLHSITTDAAGITTITSSIVKTSEDQTYNDDVVIASDVTITGNDVSFMKTLKSSLNGVNGLHVNTIDSTDNPGVDGNTLFNGVVGGDSKALEFLVTDSVADGATVNGITTIRANVTTLGPDTSTQVYNDPVELNPVGATPIVLTDTGTDGIYFNNTLNSASGSPLVDLTLTVNDPAGPPTQGDIVFRGIVGGNAGGKLGNVIVTNTRDLIANNTGGTVVTFKALSLTQQVGTGHTTFEGLVDTSSATVGGVINIGSTTPIAGNVTFFGQLKTSGGSGAGGDITVRANGHVALLGGADTRGSTTSGVTAGGNITLIPDVNSGVNITTLGGNALAPENGGGNNTSNSHTADSQTANDGIGFDILDIIALGGSFDLRGAGVDNTNSGVLSLRNLGDGRFDTLNPGRISTVATVTGNPLLFPDGVGTAPANVTINAGAVVMGKYEKASFFNNLEINTFGTGALATAGDITIGDLNAYGSIHLTVPTGADIILLTRPIGGTLNVDGFVSQDVGYDIIVGEDLVMSQTPIVAPVVGGSPAPVFSSPGANHDTTGNPGVLSSFVNREFGEMTVPLFRRAGSTTPFITLDLNSQGPSNANVSEAIAAAIPRPEQSGNVIRDTEVGRVQRELLRDLGVISRDLTSVEFLWLLSGRRMYNDLGGALSADSREVATSRLLYEPVADVLDTYRTLFFEESVDKETGAVTLKPKKDVLKQSMQTAFDAYKAGGQPFSGQGFRNFLQATPAHADALQLLNGLRELMAKMSLLDMTPSELDAVKIRVYGYVLPQGMTTTQLDQAVFAGTVVGDSGAAPAGPVSQE